MEETRLSPIVSVSAGEVSGFSEPGLGTLNWKVGGCMHALPRVLRALAGLAVSTCTAEQQPVASLPDNQWSWSWDLRCCWGPQGLGQWGLDGQARQPEAGVCQGFASLSTLRGVCVCVCAYSGLEGGWGWRVKQEELGRHLRFLFPPPRSRLLLVEGKCFWIRDRKTPLQGREGSAHGPAMPLQGDG